MNMPETWVVIALDGDDPYPYAVGEDDDDAWRAAHSRYCALVTEVPWDGFVDMCISRGWKCLRVVPAEGQT